MDGHDSRAPALLDSIDILTRTHSLTLTLAGGKLPYTIYPADFIQRSMFDMVSA